MSLAMGTEHLARLWNEIPSNLEQQLERIAAAEARSDATDSRVASLVDSLENLQSETEATRFAILDSASTSRSLEERLANLACELATLSRLRGRVRAAQRTRPGDGKNDVSAQTSRKWGVSFPGPARGSGASRPQRDQVALRGRLAHSDSSRQALSR